MLKLIAKHLVGPHTDPSSLMLMKAAMRGLSRFDTGNGLRLMRLVCRGRFMLAGGDGGQSQVALAAALSAAGETVLLHQNSIEAQRRALKAALSKQNSGANAKEPMGGCVQTKEEDLEEQAEQLERRVEHYLQPTVACVTALCRAAALQSTSKTLRSSAVVGLMKIMCAYNSTCVSEDQLFLRLVFTFLTPSYRCAPS